MNDATMSTSPGVIIYNIPDSWKRNGPMISQELTGSRTGKELGAAFWKNQPSQNKFMVVFKQRADRDTWVKTNKLLKEKTEKHKLRVTSVSYNRDRDIIIGEEKGGAETFFEKSLGAIPKVPKTKSKQSQATVSKAKVKDDELNVSRQSLDLLGSRFENLDKLDLDVSQNLFESFDQQLAPNSDPPPVKKEKSPLEILRGLEFLSFFQEQSSQAEASQGNQVDMSREKEEEEAKDVLNTSRSSNHSYNLRSRSVSPNVCQAKANDINEDTTTKAKPTPNVKIIKDANENISERVHSSSPENDVTKTKLEATSSDSPLHRLMPQFDVPPPNLVNLDVPPPPLRQPNVGLASRSSLEVMKSNILEKMRIVVIKMLVQDPGSREKVDAIANLLVDSWRPHVSALEELYEHHPPMDHDHLKAEILKVLKFQGTPLLPKIKAVELSAKFLIAAASPQVEDSFPGQFMKYLKDNTSKYKVSSEEVSFILNRNGLDLLETFKDYTRNPTPSGLKNIIQDRLNLSGHLNFEFSQILLDFFDDKLCQSSTVKKEKKPTLTKECKSPEPAKIKNLKNDWTKLSESISKKDMKASNLVKDFSKKLNVLVDEASNASNDIKTLKAANSILTMTNEDLKERMKSAQEENKVLRSRNSGLNEEAIEIRAKLDAAQSRLDVLCKILDSIAVGDDVSLDLELDNNNNPNADLDLVLRALQSLKESKPKTRNDRTKGLGQRKVNLMVDGRKFFVTTNKHNNIFAPDLEKLVGKRVEALAISQLLDNSQTREFPVVNGYIESPNLGWSDRFYDVITVNPQYHLGQGCTNTLGQRRVDARGADGPIFPPHVAGPRICTG